MVIEQKQLTLGISGVPPVSINSPFVKPGPVSNPTQAKGITGARTPDDIQSASEVRAGSPSGPAKAPRLFYEEALIRNGRAFSIYNSREINIRTVEKW
jgi:hypothetical protein